MATSLSKSDTDNPFSNCSLAFLLPRTLGSSIESADQDYFSTLFASAAKKNPTKLLEQAKMIVNNNRLSIPDASLGDRSDVLGKRSREGQMELQGRRDRQRRPGLSGVEGRAHVFNFSAKATTVEVSQMGTSNDFSERSCCVESNSQSWPVIDYSCLEHISDPAEYFSTCRMLGNAEKEINKLKGAPSPKLNQPQGRRDRPHRPGLPDLDGKKKVFKFSGMIGTVEDSTIENSTQSNGMSITESTIASCSKEISQIKDSRTVEEESNFAGNAKTCDSNMDKETDELERLLSKCRELDNDGIANIVRESLQINPILVEKSRGLTFSVAAESKFESPRLNQISSVANRHKVDGLSSLKRRLSLINRQGDPFFSKFYQDKQSDSSAEVDFNCKVFCDAGLEKLPSGERGMQREDLGMLKSDCNVINVDGIVELEQETVKTNLLDAEMTDQVDCLSALKKPIPLIDIQGRLAKLSTLNRNIIQNTTEDELLLFSHDDLEDSSFSESQEMHSRLPVDVIHPDGVSMDAHNACIMGLSNLKRSSFDDKMPSVVAEISEEDKNHDGRKISDPIGPQFTFLEDTCQRATRTISDEELVSIASGASVDDVCQSPASVDRRPSVNTNASEQILHEETPKDDDLSENPAVIDEPVEAPCDGLNGRNKNEGPSEGSGGSSNRKLGREEPPCGRRKKNSVSSRKSLAGAGCVWESGVRRSTRIRMKPLQHWRGERFLYGRIHDSLTTVIGVKRYETPPQKGRNSVMKVKSYVPEEYADLVAKAALH